MFTDIYQHIQAVLVEKRAKFSRMHVKKKTPKTPFVKKREERISQKGVKV